MSPATGRTLDSSVSTLGGAFGAACKLKGGSRFLSDADITLNGYQAAQWSAGMAGLLHSQGLSPGAHVAFLSRPSVLHTLAWFSVVRLGGITTNLHLLEKPERLVETIAWLGAERVIFDDEFSELAEQLTRDLPSTKITQLDELKSTETLAQINLDAGAAKDPVAVVLSSGSTGRPKGVVHTNASTLASISAGVDLYRGVETSDSTLICIGTSFGGWCNTVIPLVGLATRLVFQRRFHPQAFLATLANERITIAPLVPTMWRMVMNANPDGFDLSNLRLAFLSGEMATCSDVEAIMKRVTPKIRIAYLSTEGACGLGVVSDEDQFGNSTDTPAGSPIEGSKVLILDPKDLESELPTGEVGEIALSGESLAAGYWKDAERTAQRFVQGWWRSGDAGYRTREGRIVLVGRTDHVINSGGIKIQAEEIEAELMRHPAVRQAAVVGIPDLRWGQRAEAFVVVSETKVNSTILEHWAKSDDRIPAARLLKAIHIVDELPTGPTGKLFRPALIPSSSRARHVEGSVK